MFLGFLFFGWLFYAVENDIPDVELYFIPTYLVLSLWARPGSGRCSPRSNPSPRLSQANEAGRSAHSRWCCSLTFPGVGETYSNSDMSGVYRGRKDRSRRRERSAERDRPAPPQQHLLHGARRGAQQDLTLVDPFFHNTEISYADLVWPADLDLATADRLYGTDDFSGVTAAEKAAEKGPVYMIDQDVAEPRSLSGGRLGGPRGGGLLYRLVPPGGQP